MGLQTRPEPGRPIITAAQAARMLRRDLRTIRRMISDGQLEGGAKPGKTQRRWYVYLDQVQPVASPPLAAAKGLHEDSSEYRSLREEVAELRAQVASVNDANQLLLATQALILSANEQYQQASTQFADIAEDQRTLTDRYHAAAGAYRDSAHNFADALRHYRDIIAQLTTPGNLSTLTGPADQDLFP